MSAPSDHNLKRARLQAAPEEEVPVIIYQAPAECDDGVGFVPGFNKPAQFRLHSGQVIFTMASIKENFKVIISGGSMAGLALANVLERFGIDFVVLEAHSQIAPEVGASLSLLPNGFRILDQLGIYDEWVRQNKFIPQSHHTNLHNADGTLLRHVPHMLEHVISR